MNPEKSILVIGIGNLLFKDEGIGIHVVEKLRNVNLPPNVEVIDGGTSSHVFVYLLENTIIK